MRSSACGSPRRNREQCHPSSAYHYEERGRGSAATGSDGRTSQSDNDEVPPGCGACSLRRQKVVLFQGGIGRTFVKKGLYSAVDVSDKNILFALCNVN